jgi:hypothetical protein
MGERGKEWEWESDKRKVRRFGEIEANWYAGRPVVEKRSETCWKTGGKVNVEDDRKVGKDRQRMGRVEMGWPVYEVSTRKIMSEEKATMRTMDIWEHTKGGEWEVEWRDGLYRSRAVKVTATGIDSMLIR